MARFPTRHLPSAPPSHCADAPFRREMAASTRRSRIVALSCLTFAAGLLLLLDPTEAYNPSPELNDIIEKNTEIIHYLANKTREAYAKRCDNADVIACLDMQDSHCSFLSCKSKFVDRGECAGDSFGKLEITTFRGNCSHNCTSRRLLFSESSVKTPVEDPDERMASDICWTRALDKHFKVEAELFHLNPSDSLPTGTLRWQYIGTPNGVFRIYPGDVDEQCASYDPRVRPWYVAATNGPLNVVLVLDTSASMVRYNRLRLMKEAALRIVDTFSLVNHIGVVLFSDTAEHKNVMESDTLVRATHENIEAVKKTIGKMDDSIGWKTNFEDAFRETFALLNRSESAGPEAAQCFNVILFLTDGYPTAGEQNETRLVHQIQAWNKKGNSTRAFIFTFDVGDVVEESLAKAIACENDGIFERISSDRKIHDALSHYENFLSSFIIDEEVIWVEPYIDASGLGEIITGSFAVHDFTVFPPKLIGVVGIDILVTDLERADPNWREAIFLLASQAHCAEDVHDRIDPCKLEAIRVATGNPESVCLAKLRRCNESSLNENVTTLTCGRALNSSNICAPERVYFQEEACCERSRLETSVTTHEACRVSSTFLVANVNRTLGSSVLSVHYQSGIVITALGIVTIVMAHML